MGTPFLMTFATRTVASLVAAGLVELRPGSEVEVARFVADHLSRRSGASSLLTELTAALLACDDVEELFADDEELKHVVDDLGTVRG